MIGFVLVVGEEDIGEVEFSAWDVNRLEGVDEGLVEALDVVAIGRAENAGEGRLGLRKENLLHPWGRSWC